MIFIFTGVYDIALIDHQIIFVLKTVFHYFNASFYSTLFLFSIKVEEYFQTVLRTLTYYILKAVKIVKCLGLQNTVFHLNICLDCHMYRIE